MTSRTAGSRPQAASRRLARAAAASLLAAGVLAAGGLQHELRAATPESQEYLDDARQRLEEGDANAALIQLRNALQADPENIDARALLGQLYLAAGQFEAAQKELERYLQAKPGDPEMSLQLARARFGQGDYQGALGSLPQAPSDEDLAYRTALMRSEVLLALGRADEAAEVVEQLRSQRLTDVRVSVLAARTALARSRLEQAAEFAREATETDADSAAAWLVRAQVALLRQEVEDAAGYAQRAESLAPGNPASSLMLAEIDLRRGRLDEARKTIERLLESSPQAVQPRYLQAALLAAEQDFAAAEKILDQISEPLRDYRPAKFLGAMVKYQVGRYAQARTLIESYLADDPNNLAAQRLLAATLLRSDNAPRAVEVLQQAADQAPNDSNTLRLLATAQMRAGNFTDATKTLQDLAGGSSGQAAADARSLARVLEVDPGEFEGEQLTEQVALILNDLQIGELDSAQKGAEALVVAHPDNAVARNTLAGVLLVRGRDAEARKELERTLEIDPDFRAAYENLDRLDARAGTYDAIESRWKEYLGRKPNDPWAIIRYASFLAGRDRLDEARQQVEGALEARPDSPELLAAAIDLAQRGGDLDDAAAAAERLAERLPEDAQAQLRAGQSLLRMQRFEQAAARFERARELAPGQTQPLELLIQARLGAKDMAGAEQAAAALVEAQPANYRANRLLADLLVNAGKQGELDQLVERAGQIDAEMQTRLRAFLAMKAGDAAEAADMLEQLAEPSPEIVEERFAARRRAGDEARAMDLLRRWVAAHPQEPGPALLLANRIISEQRYEEAEAILTRILPAASRNPVVLNNLAWLRSELGKPGGEEMARRALSLAPDSPDIADTLGWILVQKGDLEEGTALLRQATQAAPDSPLVAYHLAYALSKTGAEEEAIAILERIVGGESGTAGDAKALLAELRK